MEYLRGQEADRVPKVFAKAAGGKGLAVTKQFWAVVGLQKRLEEGYPFAS
jgi:hypothetical protein